jgi:hypothetical protein
MWRGWTRSTDRTARASKPIIDEHGRPYPRQVGPNAVNGAFLIVQHAARQDRP